MRGKKIEELILNNHEGIIENQKQINKLIQIVEIQAKLIKQYDERINKLENGSIREREE